MYLAVQLIKAGVDRPRPAGSLVDTEGSAFPSGHAAYSTALGRGGGGGRRLARAWAAARRSWPWAPGDRRGGGLSRIYLRAHYWSDVAAGWGLGAAMLGAARSATLIVAHIRNNPERRR